MDPVAIVVLVVVVLLLLALLGWGWTTRSALLRMREMAASAGEQVERQRARRDHLRAAVEATDDPGARRALTDGQRRLDAQHGCHARLVGEDGAHGPRGEQLAGQA